MNEQKPPPKAFTVTLKLELTIEGAADEGAANRLARAPTTYQDDRAPR